MSRADIATPAGVGRLRLVVAAAALASAAAVSLAACGGGGKATGGSVPGKTKTPPASALPTDVASGAGAQVGAQTPTASAPAAPVTSAACPGGGTTVSNATGLRKALSAARPGTVIRLAPGTYSGGFTINGSGSKSAPIWVCGPRDAVLDGQDDTNYVLHLDHASWVRVVGFSVRNGKKGVIADHTDDSVISGLSVSAIGDEAIHLRAFSSNNTVSGNVVRDTGNRRDKFGEGIYVGSATSNWKTYSGGQPDRSDHNSVIGNDIAQTTSENIDIKEGTTGGIVAGNKLSADGMTAADSWIDVKGNGWLIENNVGSAGGSLKDGLQTHVVEDGWGVGNVFRGNRLTVDATGYGIYIHDKKGNTVACDNVVVGAGSGRSNIGCGGA